MSWNQSSSFAPATVTNERITSFLAKVYGWMFLGLLITALTAFVVASSPALITAFIANRILFWVLAFAQLGLVFYLSARVQKMSPTTAAGLFILYSALVGVTTSVIILAFTAASIVTTFIVTAGMFGATAIYGT